MIISGPRRATPRSSTSPGWSRALCAELGVAPDAGGTGYRLIANCAEAGAQEVPHMHVHILGGRQLGRMLPA